MNLKWLKKFNVKILAIGHAIFHASNYGFDYVLYPFVVYKLGPLYGGVVMSILAIIITLSLLFVYDHLKKDWLGLETMKELVDDFFKEEEREVKKNWKKKWKKIFNYIFNKNKIGQFIFLSIQFDPLITTIYMRSGHHLYNGLRTRDWKIYLASTVVANVWWTGIAFAAISVLREGIVKFF